MNTLVPYRTMRTITHFSLRNITSVLKAKYGKEMFSQNYNNLSSHNGLMPNLPKFELTLKQIIRGLVQMGLFSQGSLNEITTIVRNSTVSNGMVVFDEERLFNHLDQFICEEGGLNEWFFTLQSELNLEPDEIEILGIDPRSNVLMPYYSNVFQITDEEDKLYAMDLMMMLVNDHRSQNQQVMSTLETFTMPHNGEMLSFQGLDDTLYYPDNYIGSEGLEVLFHDKYVNPMDLLEMNCQLVMQYQCP